MMPIALGYHYGFTGPVGAHPVARELPAPFLPTITGGGVLSAALLQNGRILQFDDSRTYTLTVHNANALTNAALQARGDQRPYIRLATDDGAAGDAANLQPDAAVSGETRTFRVEGVWLGSADDTRPDFVIERASPAGTGFDWDELIFRGATLDPGGVRGDGTGITPLRLRIVGRVRRLVIERSIVGPILVEQLADCADSGFVGELVIQDSIVDASNFDPSMAIDCVTGRVVLDRVTVIGDVDVALLEASDSIILGTLNVLNQQQSCLRFSAVSPGGSLPRLFEVFGPARPSERVPETPIVPAFFTSLRFGDPGYASLSVVAPQEIREGAENGSEMGAFSSLLRPIRLNSIMNKVDEFKPAGVIAQYILEGEDAPFPREDGETS
jgi:hypothetical protein